MNYNTQISQRQKWNIQRKEKMEIGIKHTTDSLDVENKALIIAVETNNNYTAWKKQKKLQEIQWYKRMDRLH